MSKKKLIDIAREYVDRYPDITSSFKIADLILSENNHIVSSRDTVRKTVERVFAAKKSYKDADRSSRENYKFEQVGDEATLTSPKLDRIITLEQLLEAANIDTDVWEVERFTVNKWEVAGIPKVTGSTKEGWERSSSNFMVQDLWQVKASLKRKVDEINLKKVKEELIDDMKNYIFPVKSFHSNKEGLETMAQINIFDAHIDKLAWWEETGENYDTKIAIERFNACVDDLLSKSEMFNPEFILLPVGQDFFNTNNDDNTTKKGTRQDVDARDKKSFRKGVALLRNTIDKLSIVAPVKVVVVRGNHDEDKSWYLGEVLNAIYEDNENVEIDNGAKNRKYVHYHNCLIGLTHGDKEKAANLPGIMAQEVPHLWGQTKYREFHMGHFHHEKVKEMIGCTLRWMRSISGTDVWHSDAGYVGSIKSAECFIWHRHDGLIGNFYKNF